MEHLEELNNPIWECLNGPHSHFAIGTDNVKHYPIDVFIGAGLKHNSEDDLRELATLFQAEQTVGIFGMPEQNTEEWITAYSEKTVQMICPGRIPIPEHKVDIVTLSAENVAEMRALIQLTEPGPFIARMHEMGAYIGIHDRGQLIAMAGSRLVTPHYRTLSAICTHPDYRGRGYAALLISILVNKYFDDGMIPFLHVKPDNTRAIRLYENLGFIHNRKINLMLIQRVSGDEKSTPD